MKADNTDDLEDIPSLSVSQDDIRIDRRAPTPKSDSGAKGSPVLMGLVVLLVGALGAVAYFGHQQTQALKAQLESNQQAFELTLQRLQDVSGKVIATGESMDQSDTKVQAELRVVNSEIRKLWDVSNKRNKRNIAENGALLEKQAKLIAALTVARKAQEKSLKAYRSELGKEQERTKALASQIQLSSTEQAARLEVLLERLDSLEALNARFELFQKQYSADLEAANSLSADNQDALRSIDAFRRQVNSQLLEMRNNLNQLQGSSG
ncbi:hypothetical protein MIB92_17935 [Aestuariirhabdus sp. Z084]|uniref:hypothetical protein n=1 Tax=Aestuariirhabdus haliotis TaxID=2918751 RepID=UPI00201B420E|nr:hypothetical protein [Aestuariirhabdus haliotis]MCL6417546.1 hypothetical protein [Aestuariirhabdus haliotis]MCL6421499.1 hypothetical protein [Aestuariirhabdus haliotis]